MLGGSGGLAESDSAESATASSGSDEDVEDEGGLDEWGWDSMVDEFLEALVAEAPRRDIGAPAGRGGAIAGAGGGAAVDWTWVACRFLETLEPDEDQAAAALDRFSPGELQARWDYLQQRRAEAEAGAAEAEAAAEEAAEAAAPADALPQGEGLHAERQAAHQPPPGRDRVFEAMQSFLLGRPRPEPAQAAEAAPPPAGAEAPPAAATGAPSPGPAGAAASRGLPGARGASAGAALADADGLRGPADSAQLPAGPGEALRRCLEELRWHGEALRRCASGEEAPPLCREAIRRRRALFWSLGVGRELPT